MSDNKMEYVRYAAPPSPRLRTDRLRRRLGKSGLKISKVILGTMSYGAKDWQDWVLNEDEALPLIEHAYKSGINTWDTVPPPPHSPHLYLQWFITT